MEVIGCLLGQDRFRSKFSTAVKEFAFSLNFYSPRAYSYVRQKFNYNLPHPSTLRQWYAKSDADGEPGFCQAGLNCMKQLADNEKQNGKQFFCTLAFDEIFIRHHVQYNDSQKKFMGFVTYGHDENEPLPVATQAIVFLVNGINVPISIPVAHQFIAKLNAKNKSHLLRDVITEISKTGAKIINVAFDGLVMNFTTMEELGANFKLDDFRPYFQNPVDKSVIRIILDPPHMLKLIRNCLENKKHMYDSQNRKIQWNHIVNLESFGEKNEFLTHKLTKKHINIDGRKMNVRIAAQTLSNSVANSLEYLMKQGRKGFKHCDGTIDYCRMWNKLFDIFNTMPDVTLEKCNGNIFKVPMNAENANEIMLVLDQAWKYIISLRLNRTGVLMSKRKTGFLGFLVNIHNLKEMYNEFIAASKISNIPTYQLGQDSLESFFSRIRSKRGGCDDNLTVEQFKSAFRKVIVNKEITSSCFANCRDKLNILSVTSTREKSKMLNHSISKTNADEFESFSTNDFLLDACLEATIVNISTDIENKIRKRGRSYPDDFSLRCIDVLNENSCLDTENIFNDQQIPCTTTMYVCKVARKYFDIFSKKINFDYDSLFDVIINKIDYEAIYPNSDFCDNSELKDCFVQFIVEEFLRFQANNLAKTLTMNQQCKAIRQKLSKTIHFYGQ